MASPDDDFDTPLTAFSRKPNDYKRKGPDGPPYVSSPHGEVVTSGKRKGKRKAQRKDAKRNATARQFCPPCERAHWTANDQRHGPSQLSCIAR